jgi:large subunit ribosomal protein L13
MKTRSIKQSEIEEKWFLINAEGMRIGQVASKAAELLLGKKNRLVRDNLDPRTKVVIINSSRLDITPKRSFTKFYKRYSGFPGGLKFISLEEQAKKNSNFIIENAVSGMLPKNKRGNKLLSNLKVYPGTEHKHEAQKLEEINIKDLNL